MELKIFQIDAFATEVFRGNPAAVCPLVSWISDELMQQIAAENNLSETAFLVPEGEEFRLRWFAPSTEIELCGHATLAAAYVLSSELGFVKNPIVFHTQSGELRVMVSGERFTLDFPSQPPGPCEMPARLLPSLGIEAAEVLMSPAKVLASQDYFVVVESESQVRNLKPNFSGLFGLPGRGVIVTAPGTEHDFVSRCFFPNVGVNEDPVTGSAHCALAPYWSSKFGKPSLRAAQLSARGGEILCEVRGNRVFMTGAAVKYLSGTIQVPS